MRTSSSPSTARTRCQGSGQNIRTAFLARQLGKCAKRGCPKWHGFGPCFAVGQHEAAALEIDPFPPKRQYLGQTAPREDQCRIAAMPSPSKARLEGPHGVRMNIDILAG